MNILQLAAIDNGGASWFYRDAIISHTDHHCRAVRATSNWLDYPADVLEPEPEEIHRLYQWADVIHLHDESGGLIQPGSNPKPTVVTYHGSRYRRYHTQFNARCQRKGWLVTVSTLDLTAWGAEWVPTPRRDLSEYWIPANKFVACHAPTNRDIKGTEMVLEAVGRAPGCRLQFIEHTPYRKAIQKKAKAHVLIDQFELGYGSNAVEAWAFGMPVVANAKAKIKARMLEAWGYLPFVEAEANPEALVKVLGRLRTDWAFYIAAQELGRRHYEQFHRPDRVAERLVALYEQVMG